MDNVGFLTRADDLQKALRDDAQASALSPLQAVNVVVISEVVAVLINSHNLPTLV